MVDMHSDSLFFVRVPLFSGMASHNHDSGRVVVFVLLQIMQEYKIWRSSEVYASPEEQLQKVEGGLGVYQYKLLTVTGNKMMAGMLVDFMVCDSDQTDIIPTKRISLHPEQAHDNL